MNYSEFRTGMRKVALTGPMIDDAGQLACLIIGASAVGGGIAGVIAAKTTSATEADQETLKRNYENNRMKADIDYMNTKLKREYFNKSLPASSVKAARILG